MGNYCFFVQYPISLARTHFNYRLSVFNYALFIVTVKGCSVMSLKHRIISAAAAALVCVTCAAPAMSGAAFAVAGDPEEPLDLALFDVEGDSAGLLDRFERAMNKTVYEATYRDLARITTLNLSELDLQTLPTALNYMDGLRSINLSKNYLTNDSFKNITLRKSRDLNSFNLSDNYLTTLPSWCFSLPGITSRNYNRNFIESDNPRSIKVLNDEYNFLNGDEIDAEEFAQEIIDSIRLNNGEKLPFIFDESEDFGNPPIIEETGLKAFTDKIKDGVIDISGSSDGVNLTVQLFASGNNSYSTANIKIIILDNVSPNVVQAQLTALLLECKELNKEDYTENSWNNYEPAQKSAETISTYADADSQMIVNALNSLTSARNALVRGVNSDIKKTLTDLSTAGKTYKAEDYTESSWEPFNLALEELNTISNDKNATLSDANAAITAYQYAQDSLERTQLNTPGTLTKAQFLGILGENRSLNASGTTRNGTYYSWSFNGTDVTNPVDFNPAVVDGSSSDEQILKEVGSADNFKTFTISQTTNFPAKATFSISSYGFGDGTVYLYKWNNSKGTVQAATQINGGRLSVTLTEGGTYYITPTLGKFELESKKFVVNNDDKTVTIPLSRGGTTVQQFKEDFQITEGLQVRDQRNTAQSDSSYVNSNMRVYLGNQSFSITVIGDVNNDGRVNAADASVILRYAAGITNNINRSGSDANSDEKINVADAVTILKTIAS